MSDIYNGFCFFGFYCEEGIINGMMCFEGILRLYYGVKFCNDCLLCIGGKYCFEFGLFVVIDVCKVGYYCLVEEDIRYLDLSNF